MEYTFSVKDLDDLKDAAKDIVEILGAQFVPINIIMFKGSMGAGKTTLIRDICEEMGVVDTVTSPTFAIINEYHTSYGESIYHFDLYRINSPEELFDMGYEEYFYGGGLSLIEWPEKAEQIIPFDDPSMRIATITIDVNDKNHRDITLSIN